MMADWQPIETAPKDGSVIDLWADAWGGPRRYPNCRWRADEWLDDYERCWEQEYSEAMGAYHARYEFEPTHWMPLPPPPHPCDSER